MSTAKTWIASCHTSLSAKDGFAKTDGGGVDCSAQTRKDVSLCVRLREKRARRRGTWRSMVA